MFHEAQNLCGDFYFLINNNCLLLESYENEVLNTLDGWNELAPNIKDDIVKTLTSTANKTRVYLTDYIELSSAEQKLQQTNLNDSLVPLDYSLSASIAGTPSSYKLFKNISSDDGGSDNCWVYYGNIGIDASKLFEIDLSVESRIHSIKLAPCKYAVENITSEASRSELPPAFPQIATMKMPCGLM